MKKQRVKRISEEIGAGGVVYRARRGDTPLLLMIRDPYNRWTFPKGHQDPGEPLERTALRETREEVGLATLTPKGLLGIVEYTAEKPSPTGQWARHVVQKTVHYYLLEGADEPLTPNPAEKIYEAKWVTIEEARSLLGYENTRKVLEQAIAMLAPS